MVQQQTNGMRTKPIKERVFKDFTRTQSDKSVNLDEFASSLIKPEDTASSFSSIESLSTRSRERSRSRDLRDIPQRETSYSWRKNFNSNFYNLLEEEKCLKGNEDHKSKLSKDKPNQNHTFNQSPSMSILQIKLAGESRLKSNQDQTQQHNDSFRKLSANKAKDVEKSTFDVDVQEKREIFEGKQDDENRPRIRRFKRQDSIETANKNKTSRENWNSIREKHCPITSGLVNQDKGESLRSSILGDKKISFKNLKFTKTCHEDISCADVKTDQKSITSTKEFEDTATAILTQMRKQRRSLQMEYVSKVSVAPIPAKKPTSGRAPTP